MATKEFIGPVDCYGALLPDEEYFLLMGRDPIGPGLAMIWASILSNPDTAKSEEAVEVAQRMVGWRERNLTAGVGGKPSWKHSPARGVERFVIAYGERTLAGPQRINIAFEDWPFWAKSLRAPEPEAAKIACGLRQVAQNMTGRANREVPVDSDEHGFDLESLDQYADRINGFAAELEIIAGKPLMISSTSGELPLEGQ
jgi:hypothetical protein